MAAVLSIANTDMPGGQASHTPPKQDDNIPAPSTNDAPARFLNLAAETRNTIYSYTFANESPQADGHNLALLSLPKITGVSKQIRKETIPLFFSETNFHINIASNLSTRKWIRKDPEHKGSVMARSNSGVLNMKSTSRAAFRHAGPEALLRHVEIRVVDAVLWTPNLYRTARKYTIVAKMRVDIEKGLLEVACLKGEDKSFRRSWGRARECYVFQGHSFHHVQGQDVEDVLAGAEAALKAIGEGEGPCGLSLRDLDRVARIFRYDR